MPKLNIEEVQLCEGAIKKRWSDGYPKESYKTFWDSLAEPFLNSIKTAELNNELSNSEKQAFIKVIEKKTEINASKKIWELA